MNKNVADMTQRFQSIMDGDVLIAQVYDLSKPGAVFFPTPETSEIQCGFGQVDGLVNIPPHIHNPIERSISNTSEFILVLEGVMTVTFLNQYGEKLVSLQLGKLECFLQFTGGHAIQFTEGAQYIELKQGPYLGNYKDKTILFD